MLTNEVCIRISLELVDTIICNCSNSKIIQLTSAYSDRKVKESLDYHQRVIKRVIRESSGSHQGVIRESSGSHQIVIRAIQCVIVITIGHILNLKIFFVIIPYHILGSMKTLHFFLQLTKPDGTIIRICLMKILAVTLGAQKKKE